MSDPEEPTEPATPASPTPESAPSEPQIDAQNTLLIAVDYRIRANNSVRNIVYPFFLNEGPA